MKRVLISIILALLFTIFLSTEVFALKEPQTQQEIDGSFDDWKDKPYLSDYKRDIVSSSLNFTEVRYFADGEYLYLYVERKSGGKYQSWDFDLLILNPERGWKNYGLIPTKFEYDRKYNYYTASDFKRAKYVKFDISTDYNYKKNNKGTPIKVCLNGEKIESSMSVSSNNKRVEFRIPLEKVGLEGENKEIKFMLKSAFDIKSYKKGLYPYDWIANGKPIVLTTGSTCWQMSALIFFIIVLFIGYRDFSQNFNLCTSKISRNIG
ncbi:Firmicu-CTERM sorting domain-containing protein [Wukongibacter sp. M2B1]|uniref:Firmicu-CTERM sorting domain-containing protein n=1 Tax=Wukongibacter sp. M2B1 TaxID=3088895 RepID=UPI003D793FE2